MIFWSKTPKTKQEKLKARQQRDLKALIHQQHMDSIDQQKEDFGEHLEEAGVDENAGLDEDLISKAGRKKQQAQYMIQEASKSLARLKQRKKSLGRSKSRSRRKARQLGF